MTWSYRKVAQVQTQNPCPKALPVMELGQTVGHEAPVREPCLQVVQMPEPC